MHVEAEHVRGAVQRVAPVQAYVLLQRFGRRDLEKAPVLERFGDDGHGGPVRVEEVRAGLRGVDAGLLGGEHHVVDPALDVAEAAVDRQRAGDVGGVEAVDLHAHVEQRQVARLHPAVVAYPVQRRRVRAGGDDGPVADVVALEPRASPERAFDPALAAVHAGRGRQLAYALGEAATGDGDRPLELADLEGSLQQPQLAAGDAKGRFAWLVTGASHLAVDPRSRSRGSPGCVPGASPSSAPGSSSSGRQVMPSAAAVSFTPRRGPTHSSP